MMSSDHAKHGVRCHECGYSLQGLVGPERCPECGGKITESMLEPIIERETDPGDAVERSGLGIIGACTWCSALLLCGLMLKPHLGALIIVASLFLSIARFQGWLRLHRGPLRRFDATRFELVVRITTILELGFLLLVLILWFGPWTIPISIWTLVTGIGVVIGVIGIAGPAMAAALVGKRVHDPILLWVGIVSVIASLVAGLASLVTLAISFGVQLRRNQANDAESLLYFGMLATTLLFGIIAAHFGRVAINGIQSVLLESFIERRSSGIDGARVGGAWISARTGRRPVAFNEPVESDPLPLSPSKPPRRDQSRPDSS